MTYKILHFSDLHLDTSFAGQGFPLEYGVERRLDLRACLARILARARDLKVDAITIGGDLFDNKYLLPETAEFMQQQFALINPIRVIIAPGERDPYTNDSPYAQLNWSDNVDIFYQNKLTCLELSDNIFLWGACNPPSHGHILFDNFKPANGMNILLLHGLQICSNNANDIDVIDYVALKKSGFKLVLLGGEHINDVCSKDQIVCLSPGSPEPLIQEEENRAHQIFSIEINAQDINSQSFDIRQWRYSVMQFDITECSSNIDTARRISNLLEKENRNPSRSAIIVELKGRPQFDLNISALRELITSNAFYRLECHISLNYDIEQLSHELTVRGLLVNHFQERMFKALSESERNHEMTALNMALRALEGKEVSLYEIKAD